MAQAWSIGGEPAAPTRRAAVPSRPRYTVEDFLILVWRRRGLMLAVFLAVLLAGLLFASRLKTTYPASSSLLVRLGQAYVYDPRVGDAGRGQRFQTDAIIQSEVAILGSPALKDRVVRDIGLARLYPALGRGYARANTATRAALQAAAIKNLEGALKISTAPDTSIVRLSFSHPDPKVAALVLNTLVDEYLVYRREVLAARDTGPLEEQRRAAEGRLAQVDAAYTQFLTDNGIGDFDAEKTSLGALYGQLLTDSYTVAAQLGETRGRLGVTARQVAATPREVGLSRDLDHTAYDRLASLRVELQDLRARYKPDSQPVQDKVAQVEAMQRLAVATADETQARRLGANPVFQTAQTERNTLEAQLASFVSRKAADDREIARVLARRQQLARLEPRYQELTRQRDLLSAGVRNFASREQDAQAAQALAARGDDSVRVVQRAYVPTRGVNLKRPAVVVSVLFATFAALCAGLLGAALDRSYPSTASAERTLDLPVLASVRRRPRAV